MILAYARVSTLDQAKDCATSLPEQLRKCKAVGDLHNAGPYDFLTYVDDGVSGAIPLSERPEGAKLLADAKKGDFIVAAKLDRLFRSASDALNMAERFRKQGIHLVLVDMGVTPVTENGTAKLFFGMLALVAEFERERIAERMVDGKRAKKEKGGHIAGSAPFGWSVIGVGRESKLEPIEHEQAVLKRIVELKQAQGTRKRHVISRIRKQLEAEGLRARTGKPFQTIQIERILERNAILLSAAPPAASEALQ